MVEEEGPRVLVCIAREQMQGALTEAHGEPVLIQRIEIPQTGQIAVGFTGSIVDFAAFMLAAQARFGPYDSEMLARIVVIAAQVGLEYQFAFPGLELY